MITKIIAEILLNWVAMGIILSLVMAVFLYFAVFCEKIVDSIFKR